MSNITNALSYMGSQAWDDLCEAFAEQTTYGHTGIYPSATAAWNAQLSKAVQGSLTGAQPGDLVYFSDPTNPDGHTGIYTGNNKFTSATYGGVENNDIGSWLKETGQKLLGYIPQGQSAQGLGQSLNQQNTSALSSAQQTISDMNSGKTIWDDNKRAQANNVLAAASPSAQTAQTGQQPDFAQEMASFGQVWDATHTTPLQNYL